MNKPYIIAHRGSSFKAPENTMESVLLAWKEKADALEVDIHLSLDNQIVVIHDRNTKRTTGIKRKIKDTTLSELKSLDAGSWKADKWQGALVPSLEEVLTTVPKNKRIFIEIKSGVATLTALKNLLEQSNLLHEQIVIMSFGLTVVTKAKKMFPQIEVLWLKEFIVTKLFKSVKNELKKAIAQALEHKLDGLNIENVKELDKNFILEMKKNNLKCYCWTVDDPMRASELLTWGIDGVTTNKPKELRQNITL
jgi:glycerophosphoryl diester phosphodiesterase